MSEDVENTEKKESSSFGRKARSFAASVVGVLASSTSFANVADAKNVEQDDNSKVYVTTHAEESFSKRGKTYEIKVNRHVEENSEDDVVATTVVSETAEKRNATYTKSENSVENYDIASGASRKTSIEESYEKRRRSGQVKSSEKSTSSTLYSESGAVDNTLGHDYEAESSQFSSEHDKFDRKGRYKKSEIHVEMNLLDEGYRRDNVAKYDYAEDDGASSGVGDSEKYSVKKSYSARAESEDGSVSAHLEANKGNKSFIATIVNAGTEFYEISDTEYSTRLVSNGDEQTGMEVSLVDGNKRDLSSAELRKEFKIARMKADRVIRKVTKGELTSVREYLSSTKEGLVVGEMTKLGDVFDITQKQFEQIADEKEKLRESHDESVETAKGITAKDIVMQRIAETQSK